MKRKKRNKVNGDRVAQAIFFALIGGFIFFTAWSLVSMTRTQKTILAQMGEIAAKKPEVVETSNGTSDYVWLVDQKFTDSLPHCALNYDNTTGEPYNKNFCYDFYGWNGYHGVGIVNLNAPIK